VTWFTIFGLSTTWPNFIALNRRGGALRLPFLKQHEKGIMLNIVLQTKVIFGAIRVFVILTRNCFS
jgi:hypothetical protein